LIRYTSKQYYTPLKTEIKGDFENVYEFSMKTKRTSSVPKDEAEEVDQKVFFSAVQ